MSQYNGKRRREDQATILHSAYVIIRNIRQERGERFSPQVCRADYAPQHAWGSWEGLTVWVCPASQKIERWDPMGAQPFEVIAAW